MIALAAAACDDDPFAPVDWTAEPDTVLLFSLSSPDHIGHPSGFDLVNRRRVQVEQPGAAGNWDFALAEQGGDFVLMPSGAFQGAAPGAGIALLDAGAVFEEVDRAPRDVDRYVRTEAVPLIPGRVYVVRSRAVPTFMGTCRFHSKLEVVQVAAGDSWVTFHHVSNPNCNDRALVPRNS